MAKISLIYEDKNFLAVNKPAGVLVHSVENPKSQIQKSKVSEPTLVDWLLEHYPEVKNVGDEPETRPGIVHRLDKDTSGVMLVARNQDSFNYLKNLFQNHEVKKNYLALVYGKLEPKSGEIKKPISLKSNSVKRTVWKGKMEKEAITEYKVLEYFTKTRINADRNADKRGYISENQRNDNQRESATFSLLKVWPKTGRTHQIRIHLSSIGHPVVGDSLYGPKKNSLNLDRQFLHAESLEFTPQSGARLKLESGLPEDLRVILDGLRKKS